MPKPLSTAGLSLTDVYASVAEDLKQRIGDAQAAQAGPPITEALEPATDEKRVAAWLARRPEATDEAMMTMAQEKYAAHRAAGLDEEKAKRATAEDLTHFRYAYRLKQYTYGQIGYADQVKEARRLSKLAARKTTPDPPPPPPTMPSASLTNFETMGVLPADPGILPPASAGIPGPASAAPTSDGVRRPAIIPPGTAQTSALMPLTPEMLPVALPPPEPPLEEPPRGY